MKTLANVARLHLVDGRTSTVALPWAVLALSWAINLVIFSAIVTPAGGGRSGGLATIFVFSLVLGIIVAARFLPFGLTLGLSRRTYYLGLLVFIGAVGVIDAAALTVLNLVESQTHGWGLQLHFFRIPWLLAGPWYWTFLTSLVLLLASFLLGTLFAFIYRRVGLVGLVAFLATVAVLLTGVALLISWQGSWTGVGHFFKHLTALSLTGWLAAFAAALAVASYATIRGTSV
jgi:hypothetical protein